MRQIERLSGAEMAVLSLVTFALIAGGWAWLGRPVILPRSPLADGKLPCVSYTPFRGTETPLRVDGAVITEAAIAADLARLAQITHCVRTYSSAGFNLERVAALAQEQGLKVLQGIWLGADPAANRVEIEQGVLLANRYPDTIRALVVGNEVLLRRELTAEALSVIIKEVKARVPVPVTYADVWEFWLTNKDVATAVDFITIHMLPYWENEPKSAGEAPAHVAEIYDQTREAFPGREILIGEVGWPSEGRMREAALPSRINQARFLHAVVDWARRHSADANLIEAFDQPWKRSLEGTVGGHWGLFESRSREPKFVWGAELSDHPAWRWQAALGITLAAATLAVAWLTAGRRAVATAARRRDALAWGAIALSAATVGLVAGLALEALIYGAHGSGGALRLAGFGLLILTAPVVAAALASGERLPTLAEVLRAETARRLDPRARAAGVMLALTTVAAVQTGLLLVFAARYADFPYAALTAAAVPLLLLAWLVPQPGGAARGTTETVAAAVLGLSALVIGIGEGGSNWQALWLVAALVATAATLLRVRSAPAPK